MNVEDDGDGRALAAVELAELVRSADDVALHALALLSGLGPEISATNPISLSADEVADVLRQIDRLGDLCDQARSLAERVTPSDMHIRWSALQDEAAAALADGVGDDRRVCVLARCLSTRVGLRALAESLRTSDVHLSWSETTLGDVLGSFRAADEHFVRRLACLAGLSPEMPWSTSTRDQVDQLAKVLDEHADTERCR